MKHLEGITFDITFPGRSLGEFVSHFWCSRWNAGVRECISYHATANTNAELVFAFAPGSTFVFSSLQGHTSRYDCIKAGGFSEMFGVSLYSYGIPFFFETSACELAGQLVDLREVAPDADLIAHRLACCNSFDERVEVMTRYLKNRFNPNRKTDPSVINAIKTMRAMRGQVNIVSLSKECSLSQKQFGRRFKGFTGFNPKLYSRILRFENSIWPYDNDMNFTGKALDLGYYDQAHFINDFKQFSGFSPGNYNPVTQ